MDGRWWIIRGWAETELSIDQQGGIRGPIKEGSYFIGTLSYKSSQRSEPWDSSS